MNRNINLTGSDAIVERRHTERAWDIGFTVTQTTLHDVLIGFFLILFGKLDTLSMPGRHHLTLRVNDQEHSTLSKSDGAFRVNLSRNDLESVLSYLLDYERDGMASVNHLDVELKNLSCPSDDVMLIVRSAETKPPMSADEARKILG
jgi:hypothetical protein